MAHTTFSHGRRQRGAGGAWALWIFIHGTDIVEIACLHDQNKSDFFEGPAFSS